MMFIIFEIDIKDEFENNEEPSVKPQRVQQVKYRSKGLLMFLFLFSCSLDSAPVGELSFVRDGIVVSNSKEDLSNGAKKIGSSWVFQQKWEPGKSYELADIQGVALRIQSVYPFILIRWVAFYRCLLGAGPPNTQISWSPSGTFLAVEIRERSCFCSTDGVGNLRKKKLLMGLSSKLFGVKMSSIYFWPNNLPKPMFDPSIKS